MPAEQLTNAAAKRLQGHLLIVQVQGFWCIYAKNLALWKWSYPGHFQKQAKINAH
jgi:hypothetical protein